MLMHWRILVDIRTPRRSMDWYFPFFPVVVHDTTQTSGKSVGTV